MFGYPFGFGSDISDFRVFRYRCVEPIWVFLYFGSCSSIFSSDSVISDRFRYLDFQKKIKNFHFSNFLYLKI